MRDGNREARADMLTGGLTGRRKKRQAVSVVQKGSPLMIVLFLLPAMLCVGFMSYFPSVDGILMAFQRVRNTDLYTRAFCGWKNFENVFITRGFWEMWKQTIVWMIGCVLCELVMGMTIALVLNRPFRGKRIIESVVFLPWALSSFTVGVIFRWLFNGSCGIINDVLRRLGMIRENIPFLADVRYAMPSVMSARVWTGFAFFAITIMAALKTIPHELNEAAMIDGASGRQIFWHITLPHLKTILIFGTILRTMAAYGTSELIIALTGGGPMNKTHIISSYIYTTMLAGTDYGKLAAFSIISWLFITTVNLMYLALYRAITKGDE